MRIHTLLSNILAGNDKEITKFQQRFKNTFFPIYPVDFSINYSPKFNTIKIHNLDKLLLFDEIQEREILKANLQGIERIYLNCQTKTTLLKNPELYIKERKIGTYKPKQLTTLTHNLKNNTFTCNLYRLCIFCSIIQAFQIPLLCLSITHYLTSTTIPLIAIYNLSLPKITSFIKTLYHLSTTEKTIFTIFPEPQQSTFSLVIIPIIPIQNDINITIYLEDYLLKFTEQTQLPSPLNLNFELLKTTFDLIELSFNLFLFLCSPIDLTKPSFYDINQILLSKVIFPIEMIDN